MKNCKILRIDLSTESVTTESSEPYTDRFLGGRGVNSMLLFEGLAPGTDALDPGNPIIFGVGPLAGMTFPDGSNAPLHRMEVTSKSPETGLLGSSNIGGAIGLAVRRAGYSHIVVTGKAKKPSYIWIHDDQVAVRDASRLWGKDTYDTEDLIHEEIDPEAQVICIGPAGENLVRFASVRHKEGHSASRTGMGCVMGSKNLKALVVKGTHPIEFPNLDSATGAVQDTYDELDKRWWTQEIKTHGMIRIVDDYNILWNNGSPDQTGRVRDLHKIRKPKKYGCEGCRLACMEYYPKEDGKQGTVVQCAFYIWPSFMVRNTDAEVLLEAVDLSQRNGIDIISAMGIIGWIMTLHEHGIVTSEQFDGIDLSWGNRKAILGLLEKMIHRDGIGDVLANGMKPAAEHFGPEAEFHAIHIKGLPIYGISNPDVVIGDKDVSLSLVVSSRGDTMKAHFPGETVDNLKRTLAEEGPEAYAAAMYQKADDLEITQKAFDTKEYEGKPERTVFGEDMITVNDMLGFCKLQSWHFGSDDNLTYQAKMLSAATGRSFNSHDLIRFARRVKNVERMINVREGNTRATDVLPERLVDQEVLTEGRKQGQILDRKKLESMKAKYYYLRGWDPETGIPFKETLEDFELQDISQSSTNLPRRCILSAEVGHPEVLS